MLKIFKAIGDKGNIKLLDHIDFSYGEHISSCNNGFGTITSGNLSCIKANYELQKLNDYVKYLEIKHDEAWAKNDGFLRDFIIHRPYDYQMLENEFKDVPKTFEEYEFHDLNEEGILLFTDGVCLNYEDNGLVKKYFGRSPEICMYLIKPGAQFDMTIGENRKNYEVLQSQSLGKRLTLQRFDRKI